LAFLLAILPDKENLWQMTKVTHLRSLQALDAAIRAGSLKDAADNLGITAAAVGQRIRALEDFLGTDLLLRGRSGLTPTPELELALADLRAGFAALERVTDTLDFQRTTEIHMVADPDWAELWLAPRLPAFRKAHPKILFCINGSGDVPLRLGAPDIRIELSDGPGELLFSDRLAPVTGPDNPRRIADWDADMPMEGMPLLHLEAHRAPEHVPGWVAWFTRYGQRREGMDRGVHYKHARVALEAARENVGFLVCGLSLVMADLTQGQLVMPFPGNQYLAAPHPYRLRLRPDAETRPQSQRFIRWLREEAQHTERALHHLTEG